MVLLRLGSCSGPVMEALLNPGSGRVFVLPNSAPQYTNDCPSGDPSVRLLTFADDTTVISLIRYGDDSGVQEEPPPHHIQQHCVGIACSNSSPLVARTRKSQGRKSPPKELLEKLQKPTVSKVMRCTTKAMSPV